MAFARELVVPLLAMAVVGFLAAALVSAGGAKAKKSVQLPVTNPYSVTPMLKFGALFVGVLFAVRLAEAWLGEPGAYVASVLGGMVSASAVALSLSELAADGSLSITGATTALLVGVLSNAIVKSLMAWTQGTLKLALWLAAGLAAMLATGFLLAWLTPGVLA